MKPQLSGAVDPQPVVDAGIVVVETSAVLPRQLLPRKEGAAGPLPTAATTSGTPTASALRQQVLGTARKLAGKSLSLIEFPDEHIGWVAVALSALRGQQFDVVLASAPPHSDFLLGAAIAQRCGAKLVLDYRDPWLEQLSPDGSYGGDAIAHSQFKRSLHKTVEDRLLSRADLVLGVTPKICTWLTQRTSKPVVFLPNSLDTVPPAVALPRARPLRLVYAGSLAYERSLEPILAAMAAMRPSWQEPLQLVYAGPHGADLLAMAARLGVADLVDNRGAQPQSACLALYRGAVAGIVSVSARTDYSYPGKLFEVLAEGCPVYLCGPSDCEAAKLVQSLQAGVVDDGSDPVASQRILKGLLEAERGALPDLSGWQAAVHLDQLDGLLRGL
jgi:glycosyltransferase involved in cell wall biosynthesis